VLHTAQYIDGSVRFGETAIFLGANYLLTVRHGSSLSYAQVRARCELHPKVLRYGPAYGLYAVMDFIVDHFAPLIDAFNEELKRLEGELFQQNFDRHMIERLYALNRDLLTLRMAVAPIQDICQQLMRFHEELIAPDIRVYFRDVYDHAVRINEAADRMRELLSVAMQVNLAMVSVGQNEVVKRLAGWAGILAIPTMLASFWGMNFEHMPELKWSFGYPLALSVIGLSCVLVYRRLKKAKWL
jgi:magnesium transporter